MTNVPGTKSHVPGARNSQNPHQHSDVPGVPGVPGWFAHMRVHKRNAQTRTHILAHVSIYTRNTRNTRNKPVTARLSDVPGTRNKKITPGTLNMTKPMRIAMPATTAFIDDLRSAFGADTINATVRAGLDGQPVFWARENGIEMGTQAAHNPDRTVTMADIRLGAWGAASKPSRRN